MVLADPEISLQKLKLQKKPKQREIQGLRLVIAGEDSFIFAVESTGETKAAITSHFVLKAIDILKQRQDACMAGYVFTWSVNFKKKKKGLPKIKLLKYLHTTKFF